METNAHQRPELMLLERSQRFLFPTAEFGTVTVHVLLGQQIIVSIVCFLFRLLFPSVVSPAIVWRTSACGCGSAKSTSTSDPSTAPHRPTLGLRSTRPQQLLASPSSKRFGPSPFNSLTYRSPKVHTISPASPCKDAHISNNWTCCRPIAWTC